MSYLLFVCSGQPRNVPKRAMHVQSCCFGQVMLRANGNNIVGCYMLCLFAHPVAWLLNVVACCCAKFEIDQTFQPTTPNISFVAWSPKRSATMLYPFAQLFQHRWGHARSLSMDYKDLWVAFFPRCTAGPKLVGSCCIRFHTTANTHATTPNIVGSCCVRLHVALDLTLWFFFLHSLASRIVAAAVVSFVNPYLETVNCSPKLSWNSGHRVKKGFNMQFFTKLYVHVQCLFFDWLTKNRGYLIRKIIASNIDWR